MRAVGAQWKRKLLRLGRQGSALLLDDQVECPDGGRIRNTDDFTLPSLVHLDFGRLNLARSFFPARLDLPSLESEARHMQANPEEEQSADDDRPHPIIEEPMPDRLVDHT